MTYQLTRRFDIGRVLRDHKANCLALHEPLAERLALAGVLDRQLLCSPRETDARHRNRDSARGQESAECDFESLPFVAESIFYRNRGPVEGEAPVIGSPHAHRLVHLRHGGSRRATIDEQRDRPVGAARSGQPREEQPVVADRSKRDEVLLAAQVIGVAFTDDAAAKVGTGTRRRLGKRKCDLQFPFDRRNHEGAALLRRSKAVHGSPRSVDDVYDHTYRRMRHREELDEAEVAGERNAAAAILRRGRQRQVAAIAKLLPEFEGNSAFALDALCPLFGGSTNVRGDLALERRKGGFVEDLGPVELLQETLAFPRSCGRSSLARSRSRNF